jgi:hypothetical protein
MTEESAMREKFPTIMRMTNGGTGRKYCDVTWTYIKVHTLLVCVVAWPVPDALYIAMNYAFSCLLVQSNSLIFKAVQNLYGTNL